MERQSTPRPVVEPPTPTQHTVADTVSVEGRGLMSGAPVTLSIEPADPDHGIVFERTDLDPPVRIPASVDQCVDRPRRSAVASGEVVVETVEHCLSALAGLGIDNALLRLDAQEVPLGDGSADPFIAAIDPVGLVNQEVPRSTIKIEAPLVIEEGDAMIAAFPASGQGLHVVYELDYGQQADRIPRQAFAFDLTPDNYRRDIARARTYSLAEEAQALQSKGMCTHLSPSEVLVVGEEGPIDNAWRFDDEPVRHKVLDMIGDLSLAGAAIQGRIVASRSGHSLNRKLAAALREQASTSVAATAMRDTCMMDIRAIQRIMPHRYPMLLVDRVLEMEGDERAVGVKNVTINEPFFGGHYPKTPIMPGVLIVEAMAQLGGLLLSQRLETIGKIAVLLSLDKVKLRHPVTPGDQLILEARTVRASSRMASIDCRAFVGDKPAAEASIRFMMVDAESE
ncbi:MAG: UDP-3-O-acyl-N-acetylglucosamine deacetylase [Phycisphaerales bacterium]|nr:UDP-3-O-acyl-N-acetylglucosamine deacetylase [Phycisphaerales bacterium]